ncbi:hypothetical protein FIBSPDRAFT_1037893 [Athelia psychrophila]|uniref:Uncharacterized protein n=1 Tax=Athelia psychrophila TaxID=1759441 RepID=A0A166TUV3_9AGAM|nr:hypothetical protein FIBSPDRAFT_1037893 [Fibularhizoctonia sp. CBS 109695]
MRTSQTIANTRALHTDPQKPTDPPNRRIPSTSAPVDAKPECGTLLVGPEHFLANITNIMACALSMAFCAGLVVAGRRDAALIANGTFPNRHVPPPSLPPFLVVEDGSDSSIIPFTAIALDTRMPFTHVFGRTSSLGELKSIPVFVLTSIWPAAATAICLVLMAYIVLDVLNEVRPM